MRRTRPEMVQSFEGVKLALNILNDYYAKADKSHSVFFEGASGTVGLLEVVESRFTKGLTETAAVAAYDSEAEKNEIEKTTKEQHQVQDQGVRRLGQVHWSPSRLVGLASAPRQTLPTVR